MTNTQRGFKGIMDKEAFWITIIQRVATSGWYPVEDEFDPIQHMTTMIVDDEFDADDFDTEEEFDGVKVAIGIIATRVWMER